jgi:hypothetical protein
LPALVFLVGSLGALCLFTLEGLPAGHGFRLFCVFLAGALGLLLGISLLHRASLATRLSVFGMAALVAGGAWWLIPVADGPSLLEAQFRVATLESLPPGEVSRFLSERAAQRRAVDCFPALRPRLQAAERAWLVRTVDGVVAQAEQLAEEDPGRAGESLAQAGRDFDSLEPDDSIRARLLAARRRIFLRRLQTASTALRRLGDRGNEAAVVEMAAGYAAEIRPEAQVVGAEKELDAALGAVPALSRRRR